MPESVEKSKTQPAEFRSEPKEEWRRTELVKAALLAQHKSQDKDKDRLYRIARFVIERAIWVGLILWGGPKLLKTIECVAWVSNCSL